MTGIPKTGLPEPAMSSSNAEVNPGSFRDRDGRVYHIHGRVIRGLSASALEEFRHLQQESFFTKLVSSGKIVATREISSEEAALPEEVKSQWSGFIEHDPVAVISYPYEWTFSMLKAAAGLQLELVEKAVSNGYTLKDATPYNIQFVARMPVFIDIPSFQRLQQGEPWVGYRQFCEMFLFPLLLQSYKNCDFQPFMRSAINGIDVRTAASLFGFRDRFRKGVMSHVWLQSKLTNRYGSSSENVRSNLKSAGFNRELILANVRKLRKLIAHLEWQAGASEWGDYDQCHNYSADDHLLKEQFVQTALETEKPHTVWDIGCNTGQFSRISARLCSQVVAMDTDHLAVERLVLDADTPENVLALIQNVADPSPGWGWRNRERSDLPTRSPPDLVLCLALIHHVVITANIPLAEFIDWLAGLTGKLVIEYVSRKDEKVKTLLLNKEDKYDDYSRESLQANLERHFEIRSRKDVNNGDRSLYLCVAKS
jgi:SAM-dependent methyltransferase